MIVEEDPELINLIAKKVKHRSELPAALSTQTGLVEQCKRKPPENNDYYMTLNVKAEFYIQGDY